MLYKKRRRYILHILYKNFIRWKQVKFFILSGNLLLRESQFHIVHCLKSLDFELLFVYALGGSPFDICALNFCFILKNIWLASELIRCDSQLVHERFNKTIKKLIAKFWKAGAHGIWNEGGRGYRL